MNNYVHEQRRLESVSGTFRRFFADVIAPAVQADGECAGGRMHSSDDELAFSKLEHRLVVIPMIVDAPELRVLRHRYATMSKLDLLTLDLTRLRGPIQCEMELCAEWRAETLQVCHAQVWLGGDGSVALVTESPRCVIGNEQPSVLWTPKGLVIAEVDPFADEADRERGVERASRALRRAEAATLHEQSATRGEAN